MHPTKAVIRNRNPTHHGTDNADKTLIRPAEVQIREMCMSVKNLMGCAIDGPLIVPGKSADRRWREYIRGNYAMPKVGNKSNGRSD